MEIIVEDFDEITRQVYVRAEGRCRITSKMYKTKNFSLDGYEQWKKGGLIQNVLPELNADDREFLMTQTSPMGWSQMFG